jgi:SAM-dependent methyltransferase
MASKEMLRKNHWETIYQTKSPDEVSWYQSDPMLSMKLIKDSELEKGLGIIDVGGGTSLLVDHLLDNGFEDIAVLDISENSLEISKARLGDRKDLVDWIVADVTKFNSPRKYSFWHDRAVFHFLVDEEDQKKYLEVLKKSLASNGQAVIATFALDGPSKCSGLDVVRYGSDSICETFGADFKLIGQYNESHLTPEEKEQRFTYFMFRRLNRDV